MQLSWLLCDIQLFLARFTYLLTTATTLLQGGWEHSTSEIGFYGHSLHVWDWTKRQLIQDIDLGADGQIPLEIRFLHDPNATEGFVGCALSSTVFRFYKTKMGDWAAEKVISILPKKVENWALPVMPGLITDIILSMDDKYLYFSNWLHGDIRQYDVTDTRNPKLVGQVFIGGSICKDGPVKIGNATSAAVECGAEEQTSDNIIAFCPI